MNFQFKLPQLSLRGIQDAFHALTAGARGVMPKRVPEKEEKKEKKKTKRGAVHKVNPVFKSRKVLKYTGAKYRRYHVGNPHKYAIEMMKGVKRAAKYKSV